MESGEGDVSLDALLTAAGKADREIAHLVIATVFLLALLWLGGLMRGKK